jgi:colanic acid/amylovoran biosynthesis glycosyltransferase
MVLRTKLWPLKSVISNMETKAEPINEIGVMPLAEKPKLNRRPRIAYIMSRFPKITETFILFEILAIESKGVQVEIYPLLRSHDTAIHPEGASLWKKIAERFSKPKEGILMHAEARPLVARAHYQPLLSREIIGAQFLYLKRKPKIYLKTLWALMKGTWGSANFFFGALATFPKTVSSANRMENEGVQHVHAHFANHPASAAFVVHRLTGIPYSFTAHGADLQVDQHMLCEKVSGAEFVVTISDYNKDLIIQKCGEEYRDKVVVIHCGVDTEAFRPLQPHERSNRKNPFTILCTGTMYEVKGHTYLIQAAKLLTERNVNFICHFVGDGPDRPSLEEQVERAQLDGRVFFHGQKTRREVIEFLHQADALVVPSIPTRSGRREGIPVVLMEAMSVGVPVVASRISGIPELVENEVTGLLVPPRDPQALADAIERLSQDSALVTHLASNGREKVLLDFNLFKNATTLINNFGVEFSQ